MKLKGISDAGVKRMAQSVMPETIQDHYDKAVTLAEEYVVARAREVLAENPTLEEFIKAMGTYSFTLHEGGMAYDFEDPVLDDFMADWDRFLYLSGNPVRFTATGEAIYDW